MTVINSLADLRPGDIMFTNISGAAGAGVGYGEWLLGESVEIGAFKVHHVAIVVRGQSPADARYQDKARIVQAMPHGAEEVSIGAEHWTRKHAYCRLPEDYPGQAKDAAAIARLMVAEKVAYSPLSYLALAAWRFGLKAERLERWIGRRRDPGPAIQINGPWPGQRYTPALPVEAICSVLVDQAWSLAGKRVMENVAHQAVTPGAMAGQLIRRPVTWEWPS